MRGFGVLLEAVWCLLLVLLLVLLLLLLWMLCCEPLPSQP
jgi:hypothetical protein